MKIEILGVIQPPEKSKSLFKYGSGGIIGDERSNWQYDPAVEKKHNLKAKRWNPETKALLTGSRQQTYLVVPEKVLFSG